MAVETRFCKSWKQTHLTALTNKKQTKKQANEIKSQSHDNISNLKMESLAIQLVQILALKASL